MQHRHDVALDRRRAGRTRPSVQAEMLHFFGEVEVVFGLWSVPLMVAIVAVHGLGHRRRTTSTTPSTTPEPLFVVVIMALASTRPIVTLAERVLQRIARLGGAHAGARGGASILIVAPLLGSFITEPAAMTIAALLLARQFFDLDPSRDLRYATLGPAVRQRLDRRHADPLRRAARADGRGPVGLGYAVHAEPLRLAGRRRDRRARPCCIPVFFRREFAALARRDGQSPMPSGRPDDATPGQRLLPVPAWVTIVHLAFMAWTVRERALPGAVHRRLPVLPRLRASHVAVSDASSTSRRRCWSASSWPASSSTAGCRAGGLRRCSRACREERLVLGLDAADRVQRQRAHHLSGDAGARLSATAFKVAVVEGAVTGGGLTVIANAPNPAGQALLGRFFDGAISPRKLLAGGDSAP